MQISVAVARWALGLRMGSDPTEISTGNLIDDGPANAYQSEPIHISLSAHGEMYSQSSPLFRLHVDPKISTVEAL